MEAAGSFEAVYKVRPGIKPMWTDPI